MRRSHAPLSMVEGQATEAVSKPDTFIADASLNDPLLEPFIATEDDAVRSQQVATLVVERARPLIRRIVMRCARSDRQLREQDAEDVIATVTLRLIRKLRLLDAGQGSIRKFEDYVATLTYNTVYDLVRRRFPERSRLKNRLRYVLTRDSRFSLWKTPSGLATGLAEWNGRSGVLHQIDFADGKTTGAMMDPDAPASALLAIFRHVGAAVLLEALTDATASLWGIRDSLRLVQDLPQEREPSPLARAEARQFLGVVWAEIRQLQPPHRAALLLNLHDGEGIDAIPQFLLLGVARFDEIASAVGVTPEGLAGIWNSLPLDDLKIAAMLGVSRQQVINFRRTARKRLARRLVRSP